MIKVLLLIPLDEFMQFEGLYNRMLEWAIEFQWNFVQFLLNLIQIPGANLFRYCIRICTTVCEFLPTPIIFAFRWHYMDFVGVYSSNSASFLWFSSDSVFVNLGVSFSFWISLRTSNGGFGVPRVCNSHRILPLKVVGCNGPIARYKT